ncbi:hypothetical protein [Candidatus Scalindua japonica]|uniref:hypothetical protein n=1 Tax=Candidatus Scalindua japonica TaxID=1284222 RepID=UPI0010553A00|nr:hypothetical protein [Candidatus Scalindua japonica]
MALYIKKYLIMLSCFWCVQRTLRYLFPDVECFGGQWGAFHAPLTMLDMAMVLLKKNCVNPTDLSFERTPVVESSRKRGR